jgi:hypothetical protein
MSPTDGAIAIFRQGRIDTFVPSAEGEYASGAPYKIDDKRRQAVLAWGARLAVCFDDGEIVVDPGDEHEQHFELPGSDPPRATAVSSDGQWIAIQSHAGKVWLFDCSTSAPAPFRIPGQGHISAIAFTSQGELLIADRVRRVRAVDLKTGRVTSMWSPGDDTLMALYHWMVKPLYVLLPKPQELKNVATYLTTDKKSQVLSNDQFAETNLRQERVLIDVWTPIWSNLAFLAVMLLLSCWNFSRRDF